MSSWTYVTGIIEVDPYGHNNTERRYFAETILNHMPKIYGSEENVEIQCIPTYCYAGDNDENEFGEPYGRSKKDDSCNFLITLRGNLRDTLFEDTLKGVNKFLNRLAKRINIESMSVTVWNDFPGEYHKSYTFTNQNTNMYYDLYEMPSWFDEDDTEAWWEYLLYDHVQTNLKGYYEDRRYGIFGIYPIKLHEKYKKEHQKKIRGKK